MRPPPLWVTAALAALFLLQLVRMGRAALMTGSPALARALHTWTFLAFAPILLVVLNTERTPTIEPAISVIRSYFVQVFIVVLCVSEVFLKLGQLLDIQRWLRVISLSQSPAELNRTASQLERYDVLDLALKARRKAVALDPCSASAHVQLAFLFGVMRRFTAAKDSALKAIELDPEMAFAYYYLAMSERELGQTELAREAFRKAMEVGLPESLAAIARRFLAKQSED